MIADILAWLTSAESWTGDGMILDRLLEHLLYTVLAMAFALAVAVPIGLYVGHTGKGRWLVSVANAVRAVPTLGLLFALALWLGPYLGRTSAFLVPSIVVLSLLAIPPILSGVYAGIEAVDPAARDAARGIGMTGRQVLWGVEVPVALPLVLSGIRAATLQVVATATVAAFIGLGGLGRFIIDGLAVQDYAQTAGGALLVALLALALDGVLAVLQRLVVSPGLTSRPTRTRGRRPGLPLRGSSVAPQDDALRPRPDQLTNHDPVTTTGGPP